MSSNTADSIRMYAKTPQMRPQPTPVIDATVCAPALGHSSRAGGFDKHLGAQDTTFRKLRNYVRNNGLELAFVICFWTVDS